MSTTCTVKSMVSENTVVLVGRRGCYMCYVMKRLLVGIGVDPVVYEVDGEEGEAVLTDELAAMGGGGLPMQFPVVYVGGRMVGGLEKLMGVHISGELEGMLKDVGGL
ncbi:hypothetical protein Sjap_025818 [Stephania japonica]|uniref:Glutaredoxin domain-containing protein n=1 Tax=Stephania japonica TaxID=461633 RepID=A0AAP0HHW5_9MAGN